ncbi:MAG: ribulose-phosphate 3-epimerase [Candidatus Woesearchaeota archaeon]|jgi:ribulose-phosphate 3-epimerase|nr:ribulose-phosphate 3-epimerase [Candidatus Woesearchaeota archaeon]
MTKIRILPTLFALNKEEFSNKLEKVSFSKKIHIDFMDGKFTDKKSVGFSEMDEILNTKDKVFFAHLMAYEPEEYASKIKKLNISRVYLHYEVFETDSDFQYAIEEFKSRNIEVGLAVNPGTDIEEISSYVEEIDSVLIMSVWPGKEGQTFISNTYSRTKELRGNFPKIEICVDGGINSENIKKASDSGIDVFCVGSYVSSDSHPKEHYQELEKLL